MKKMVPDFVHKEGKHCESSALRDLFEFYGFPMTENMVFGLNASFGFGFFDQDLRKFLIAGSYYIFVYPLC